MNQHVAEVVGSLPTMCKESSFQLTAASLDLMLSSRLARAHLCSKRRVAVGNEPPCGGEGQE